MKDRSKITKKISIPQYLQLAYSDIIRILSDPLSNSSLESDLANQLTETYENHAAAGSDESYEELCEHVVKLQDYIEHKNELIDIPLFMLGCEAYNSKVLPTTADKILAALDHLPLPGANERFLFDSIVHAAFMADSKNNPEELKSLVQEAMTAALQHLQSFFEYSVIPSQVIMSVPEKETIYTYASPI